MTSQVIRYIFCHYSIIQFIFKINGYVCKRIIVNMTALYDKLCEFYFYCHFYKSASAMWEPNKLLADRVQGVLSELQFLKDNKAKMNLELNDYYQQVTRLELEV